VLRFAPASFAYWRLLGYITFVPCVSVRYHSAQVATTKARPQEVRTPASEINRQVC